jgi:hypothetical protein
MKRENGSMNTRKNLDALESIPEPDKVREKLQQNLTERQMLRQLLKVAERKFANRKKQDTQ